MRSSLLLPIPSTGFRSSHRIALVVAVLAVVAALLSPLRAADAAPGAPIGHLDSIVTSGSKVTVTAWAIDRDTPTNPVTIRLYLDGKYHSGHKADKTRNDVARAYPGTGSNHGLTTTISIDKARSRELCVFAINTTGNSPHTKLGCRIVGDRAAPAPAPAPSGSGRSAPIGYLESMSASGSKVTVTARAIDRDTPTSPVTIRQ